MAEMEAGEISSLECVDQQAVRGLALRPLPYKIVELDLNEEDAVSEAAPPLPLEKVPGKKEISIVFTGRSGAGKSTLINKLFDIELGEDKTLVSAESITKDHYTVTTKKNDITIKITDTLGLQQGKDTLKKLAKHVQEHANGKIDVLVYCLPVNPSSKFELQKHRHHAGTTRCIWQGHLATLLHRFHFE